MQRFAATMHPYDKEVYRVGLQVLGSLLVLLTSHVRIPSTRWLHWAVGSSLQPVNSVMTNLRMICHKLSFSSLLLAYCCILHCLQWWQCVAKAMIRALATKFQKEKYWDIIQKALEME